MSKKYTVELYTGGVEPDFIVTDGYHSFEELYEHRHALFLALISEMQRGRVEWREEPSFGDWICVFLQLDSGQISYHLPGKYRRYVSGFKRLGSDEKNPWDGHTSADVVERLLKYAEPPLPGGYR